MSTAASFVPAIQSALVNELFGRFTFHSGALPNLATATNPADGFEPTRLHDRTEVLWVPNPAQLGIPYGARVSPLWQNGMGLVAFRNPLAEVVGGIFVHSAIRNPWSEIRSGAFQCLGGIMVFPDTGKKAKSAEDLFRDVIFKGEAMCPKWQFHRINAEAEGIAADPRLGGGKATASHPAGEAGKMTAITVVSVVAGALGIYISGSDENMTGEDCTLFAQNAPRNFMGAVDHPLAPYGGMGDPSPWTAMGTFHAIRAARAKLFNDTPVPVFVQGYGNVGRPLVDSLIGDGHSISGIIDRELSKLILARDNGLTVPLYLEVPDDDGTLDAETLQRYGITVVGNLTDALREHPETVILSPNAGPHPINAGLAAYLKGSGIKAVIGAANNVFDVVDGSTEILAEMLQEAGIFIPNDSETNQMGALSVVVTPLGLSHDQLTRLAQGVGARTAEAIELFNQGIAPQIGRARIARRRYNQLVVRGEAVGGFYTGV